MEFIEKKKVNKFNKKFHEKFLVIKINKIDGIKKMTCEIIHAASIDFIFLIRSFKLPPSSLVISKLKTARVIAFNKVNDAIRSHEILSMIYAVFLINQAL